MVDHLKLIGASSIDVPCWFFSTSMAYRGLALVRFLEQILPSALVSRGSLNICDINLLYFIRPQSFVQQMGDFNSVVT